MYKFYEYAYTIVRKFITIILKLNLNWKLPVQILTTLTSIDEVSF